MDLFGESSDEEEPSLGGVRPKENGVMMFHAGTEQALLCYLRSRSPPPSTPASVLSAIDDFCLERHWMMHVGQEKSDILSSALALAAGAYRAAGQRTSPPSDPPPFVLLELGTYCGYSAVKLCDILSSASCDIPTFRVASLEVDEGYAAVARQVIAMAGLQDAVRVVVSRNVAAGLEAAGLARQAVDCLFIDHDKDDYLRDLLAVAARGLLKPGAVVVADNVVMGRIDDYRRFAAAEAAREGGLFSETRLLEASIEYGAPDLDVYTAEEMRDGIEVSIVR